jgi:hypothetical protein
MVNKQGIADWTAASGRDWNQMCQAYIWNICNTFGNAPVSYDSALTAYYNSVIVSSDVYSAPAGAIIYFDIGAYGHVSFRSDTNGDIDGMGSSKVDEFWGINAGAVSIATYIARTGAWPLGWSYNNGANSFPYESYGIPTTTDEETDDKMYPVKHNGRDIYVIGKEYIKHETSVSAAEYTRNVITPDDKFIPVNDAEFSALLDSFGIPWYAVESVLAGSGPVATVWSRNKEILDKLK